MRTAKQLLRTFVLYMTALILTAGYPMAVMAEDTPASSDSSATSTPAPAPTYTYDKDTQHWNTDKWHYDGARGAYQPAPVSAPAASDVPQTPAPADAPAPQAAAAPLTPSSASNDAAAGQPLSTGMSSTSPSATVNNTINSTAASGSATVGHNTTAGNATSGDASAQATIINTVHSSVQGDNGGVAHFVADIDGNVNGDIMLYPAIASAEVANDNALTVHNDATINNDVTLSAVSGDATVSGNTTAGSATSGTASTVANVVNLINSIIAANKSFIGTINIHGNLNGNILISPDFIPQLLASNAPNAAAQAANTSNALTADLTNNQTIINNIQLAAHSGEATVSGNTAAGEATTGTAQTNLTVLNLTGQQVVAKDSLLVFVNVLGTWVGVIVGAPAGATAALLGDGVVSSAVAGNQTIASANNAQITNNLNLSSRSGDAAVTNNTTAGSATSGSASASANIANISMSSFSLSDWFGIVFINVFGKWNGDLGFGIDKQSGKMVQLESPGASKPSITPIVQFGFVPRAEAPNASVKLPFATNAAAGQPDSPIQQAKATLAAARVQPRMPSAIHHAETATPKPAGSLRFFIAVGLMAGVPLIGLAVLVRRWLGIA